MAWPGRGIWATRSGPLVAAGFTLVELLCALVVATILAGVAVAETSAMLDRSRALGAARYLAGRMAQARAQAAGRSAAVALRFEVRLDGIAFSVYADGNRNGVRSTDIAEGVDRTVDPAVLLSDLFPGVTIGFSPDAAAASPPIGASSLYSFTPAGTSTSGTIYIRGRDGSQFAVRVFGPTARARVLRWDGATGQLSERLF